MRTLALLTLCLALATPGLAKDSLISSNTSDSDFKKVLKAIEEKPRAVIQEVADIVEGRNSTHVMSVMAATVSISLWQELYDAGTLRKFLNKSMVFGKLTKDEVTREGPGDAFYAAFLDNASIFNGAFQRTPIGQKLFKTTYENLSEAAIIKMAKDSSSFAEGLIDNGMALDFLKKRKYDAVRSIFGNLSSWGLSDFVKRGLSHPSLRVHPLIIRSVFDSFDKEDPGKILRRVNRYVLSHPDTRGVLFDTLRAAAGISDRKARSKFLAKADKIAGDWIKVTKKKESELRALIDGNALSELPQGYTMIKPSIGTGKIGVVSLVSRDSDGTLWAWKVATNDAKETKEALAEELEIAKSWSKNGLSTVQAIPGADEFSIFKSYIEGKTLKRAMLDDKIFEHPESVMYRALVDFMVRASRGHVYIGGLNAENILFDVKAERWEIIDSAHPHEFSTDMETFLEYYDSLHTKWGRDELDVYLPQIKEFYETVGKELFPGQKVPFDKKDRRQLTPGPGFLEACVDSLLGSLGKLF